jgi:hypothetical protein
MAFKKILKDISLPDIMVFGGLIFLGIGLWWFKPWVSFVTVGALLFGVGLLASFKPETKD